MGKKKKRKRRKKSQRIWLWAIPAVLLIVVLVVGVVILTGRKTGEKQMGEEESAPGSAMEGAAQEQQDIEKEKKTADIFPYQLEEGKLEVTSLFQFSGSNPDSGGEEGENIASVSLVNCSDEHLKSALITVVLTDGREVHFKVEDLPAGKSVMAFSAENEKYDLSTACEAIACTAEFETSDVVMEEKLSVDVEETAVTLTNHSAEDLENLTVYCHCLLEEEYFGGLTYSYSVEKLPAGENVAFDALDCYLGEAAVVRIEQGK